MRPRRHAHAPRPRELAPDEPGLAIALSGGGFRATLFHLGTIAAFREFDLLRRVSSITSVSGGSVLAAHLVVKWDEYVSGEFESASMPILDMITRHDVRGAIGRRLPFLVLARLALRIIATVADSLAPPSYRESSSRPAASRSR